MHTKYLVKVETSQLENAEDSSELNAKQEEKPKKARLLKKGKNFSRVFRKKCGKECQKYELGENKGQQEQC